MRIPLVSDELDRPLRVEIASTREDLEAAYSLVHDSYVRCGLMNPHPSGLRCSIFSALPHTTVLVAKYYGKVVGTVSLIRDSSFGLPGDLQYKALNDSRRSQGLQLVEISALAVDERLRQQSHLITLNLFKYLSTYCPKYMRADGLVIAIRKSAADFYSALMGFSISAAPARCEYIEGTHASVHMFYPFIHEYWETCRKKYSRRGSEFNLFDFFDDPAAPLIYPTRSPLWTVDPVLTPDLLSYFFQGNCKRNVKLS